MPFIPHTPEGLLVRNRHSSSQGYGGIGDAGGDDSACRGVTAKGEPCRRTVAAARTFGRETIGVGDVALYCWQHKDQAEGLMGTVEKRKERGRAGVGETVVASTEKKTASAKITGKLANGPVLQKRTSIDTLVARLGMVDVGGDDEKEKEKSRRHRLATRQGYGDYRPLPNKAREEKGAIHTIDEKGGRSYTRDSRYSNHRRRSDHPGSERKKKKKSSGSRGWLSAFCFPNARLDNDDDDYYEIVRHKARIADQKRRAEMAAEARNSSNNFLVPSHPLLFQQSLDNCNGKVAVREVASRNDPIHLGATSHLLSFIPKALSPQLASQLLAELSKPISPSDDEGYIYMFWLTDGNKPAPSANAASSLLPSGTHDRASPGRRRMSEQMRNAEETAQADGNDNDNGDGMRSVLLKIGRASNVHRRLNEWSRQCDYNLSLLRWYPYSPSTPQPSSSSSSPSSMPRTSTASASQAQPRRRRPSSQHTAVPARYEANSRNVSRINDCDDDSNNNNNNNNTLVRKVPHVHRVERLIHIELAEKRVRRCCAACGKEHREWFKVESSREGVRAVDEVVRRWVRWSYGQQGPA